MKQNKLTESGSLQIGRITPRYLRRLLLSAHFLVGTAMGLGTAFGDVTISDDFNDGIKNVTIWGADIGTSLSAFNESAEKLWFSSTSSTGTRTTKRPCVTSASYDEDWEVRLDVGNTGAPSTNSGWIEIGLAVGDASKPLEPAILEFRLYAADFYSGGLGRGFFSGGSQIGYRDTYSAGSTTRGSLLVTFSKTNKVITTFYDVDGSENGYNWLKLQAVGLAGSGGDSHADLGFSPGSSFTVGIYGESLGNNVPMGVAWADNFHFQNKITPIVATLPGYVHNPADGREVVKNLRLTPEGQLAFTFSTYDVGSMCIVSWTSNLKKWFPLIHFNTSAQGTEVLDTPRDPSRFYRAIYLPEGVSSAETFDYPIGSGHVDEQISPEQNDLYPGTSEGIIERPTLSQSVDGEKWRNAQDVGSYYLTSKGPGYHAGEDWNLGLGSDDIGEPIRATANGVVIDVSPLNNNSNGGWAIVLRHYLLNGEVVDSVYVHVAPPTLADHLTQNTDGTIGSESWFPFQEGMPVLKGDIIAVVADVDAEVYPDHLHFEMRSKSIPNLPLASGSAAVSAYWPHSMGNAYYATFSAMQQDGIIDPSDFIDEN